MDKEICAEPSEGARPRASDLSKGRVATRLATEHFLRSARLLSDISGGDLFKGLVLRAIIAANIGHIDTNPELSARYSSIDAVPPDELRRPVSVLALSGSLCVPYETTRRYVAALVREGLCYKVKGGVVAPSSTMRGPEFDQAIVANMVNIRRFLSALRRAGIELD